MKKYERYEKRTHQVLCPPPSCIGGVKIATGSNNGVPTTLLRPLNSSVIEKGESA